MDTQVSVVQYEDKLKKLLDRCLELSFEIKNDTYLNTLLSYLSGKDDKDFGNSLINLSIFPEWLLKALEHWEQTTILPSPTVVTFTIHLTSLLSKNEARFVALNSYNIYVRLCSVLKVRMPQISPSVKLAYVKLLASFLNHKAGIEWLIATDNWQDVLSFCLACQTIYLVREGYDFMYNLLTTSANHNLVFSSMVIEKIMIVFQEGNLINGSVLPEINDELLQKKLTPSLRLISHILESCLQSESFAKRDYTIPKLFLKDCNLEHNIWNVIMIGSQNTELSSDLNKVMILNYFFTLAIDAELELFQCKEIRKMVEEIFKLLKMLIANGAVTDIYKVCYLLNYYWKLISPRLPKVEYESNNAPLLFENQILMFQIVPLFVVSITQCCININRLDEDEFRERFVSKLFKIMCEHTIRVLYSFRTVLTNEKNSFDAAQKAIIYVMKSKKYYDRTRAVIVFQVLMYVIEDVVAYIKKEPRKAEFFAKEVSYFIAHFDAISTLVKEFDITWRESVETICLMNVMMDFINVPNWPPKLVMHALKLINLSIARFMSPNLALLVDRTSDSSMANLGPMLIGKLEDADWEVRDSALEVLYTISNIANTKFQSFQTMVLDSNLPSFMVKMSTEDNESFVRASAIKCLQEMIKVPAFWNNVLESVNLPTKMIEILYNETEAIVRCQAASLMCRIYEYQTIPNDLLDKVNEAMVYAATTDLHWEVKTNALCYWNKSITNRLSNQGMIDGSFPNVTFSKENRKIVTLTEAEIKNRLNKVLVELSKCGCLGVLLAAIQDDCDLEVVKKAVLITKNLANLLNTYNLMDDITSASTSPKAVMDTFNLTNNTFVSQFTDVGCLNEHHVTDKNKILIDKLPSNTKEVTPKIFLTFIQQDLDKFVLEKTKWLNRIDDLGSLLDDILKSYTDEDMNVMDCY